jgi:hypothetical protein
LLNERQVFSDERVDIIFKRFDNTFSCRVEIDNMILPLILIFRDNLFMFSMYDRLMIVFLLILKNVPDKEDSKKESVLFE